MDRSVAVSSVADPSVGPAAAAVPGVPSGPGWLVLRDCPMGSDGRPVCLALLHPKIGVALVDFAPTTADAAGRLRRALDDRRFPAIFGGYPPIVQVALPEDRLPELGHVVAAAFKAEPQFALEGEDSWVPTARAALEERPASTRSTGPAPRRRDVSPWRAAALIIGAMAAGAGAAAVVMTPPGRRSGNAPVSAPVAAMTASKPAHLLPETPSAALEPRPAPAAMERATPATAERAAPSPAMVEPRPAQPAADTAVSAETALARVPQQADTAAGAGTALALLPQEAGGGPAPAAEEGSPETLSPPAPTDAAAPIALRGGSAAAQPRPVQPAAGAAGTPPRAPPTADRRAPPSVATAPAAEAASGTRCRDILVKTTLGEGLSDGDKDYMRRGCQRPRS